MTNATAGAAETTPLEIPELPASTILLVEVGSTAHGTGIPGGEDHDELGIVVEPLSMIVGLDEVGFKSVMQRTQPEGSPSGPGDIDRTLHSLRRFLRMAASGNPSILMALWAPIEHATERGHELRGMADAFIGRHVIARYRGYMESQKQRLSTDKGGGRPELVERYGFDTKYAMHAARLGFQCIELLSTGGLQLPLETEDGDWLRALRRGNVDFDEWMARTEDLDAAMASLLDDDSIPKSADRARIDAWSVATHRAVWESKQPQQPKQPTKTDAEEVST